ncbi:MAG: OadG family protein [Muribaculaceae bacterium]|nr:OadG family protein [Muribaculaceae bacterium]
MKKIISTIALTLLMLAPVLASAQTRDALRINEVMVVNDNSLVDEYGNTSAWIELFNSNFAPLEISKIFITNDKNNPRKYPVPLGDVNTRISKRQHVVFFADGEPNRGTFHTNFTLIPGEENWIGIYDADGKTLIDQVTIPATLEPNHSWARTQDGTGEWAIRTGGESDYITPSSANVITDTNSKIQLFAENDEHGFGITLMAMCIVFSALLVLCLSFYAIGKIGGAISKMNKFRSHGVTRSEAKELEHLSSHDSGEEIAAIVLALHEHLNAHDTESTILTINKVKRAYSPWSSKIYSLREIPEHRRAK